MSPNDSPDRFSQISTHWSLIFEAHDKDRPRASRAQCALMQRYCGAIYRYLRATVRDANAVDELCQEFALRFVRGDFQNVHPEKGRFRGYVKTVLFHLVSDYRRQRCREAQLLPFDNDREAALASDCPPADVEFINRWKEELLNCAWKELAAHQERTGRHYFDVLRFRVDHPEKRSAAIAEELGTNLGSPLTTGAVRQLLHRARERFAELLFAETARSLDTDDAKRVEEELTDLGLLQFCQPFLRKRADSKSRDR